MPPNGEPPPTDEVERTNSSAPETIEITIINAKLSMQAIIALAGYLGAERGDAGGGAEAVGSTKVRGRRQRGEEFSGDTQAGAA